MALLYPTWEFDRSAPARKDEEIWNKLEEFVTEQDGKNKAKATDVLQAFLRVEKNKESYTWRNKNTLEKVPPAKVAVAPFPVPEEKASDFTVSKGRYYNFLHKGKRFNAKVKKVDDASETVEFEKNTLTQFRSNGSYLSKINDCYVSENEALGFQDKVVVDKKNVVVLQNEVLRPYIKFRRFVSDLFRLNPKDCRSEEQTLFILEKLRSLFANGAHLDINNLPARCVRLDLSRSTAAIRTETAKKELVKKLKREGCINSTGKDWMEQSEDELKRLLKECKKKKKEYKKFDPEYIDKVRIELDARLWSNREFNEHRREDPSIYDLFEIFSIDRTVSLKEATEIAIGILQRRKSLPSKKWEEKFYFYGDRRNISQRDVEESALVNSMHYDNFTMYQNDIVRHIFRNPFLKEKGAFEELKSKAFESGDHELAQNFASYTRYQSDNINFVQILKMPWPDTKRRLRKVNPISLSNPSKFREARYPESFYLKLKEERKACDRLRHVFYTLRLSKEKGYPVVQKVSVVTPEAYGTDYRTAPLPRIEATPADIADVNLGAEFFNGNLNFKEHNRKRKWDGQMVRILPLSKHPFYPGPVKSKFFP